MDAASAEQGVHPKVPAGFVQKVHDVRRRIPISVIDDDGGFQRRSRRGVIDVPKVPAMILKDVGDSFGDIEGVLSRFGLVQFLSFHGAVSGVADERRSAAH